MGGSGSSSPETLWVPQTAAPADVSDWLGAARACRRGGSAGLALGSSAPTAGAALSPPPQTTRDLSWPEQTRQGTLNPAGWGRTPGARCGGEVQDQFHPDSDRLHHGADKNTKAHLSPCHQLGAGYQGGGGHQ